MPAKSIDLALSNRALHNKSDRTLSHDESFLLSHGMSFIPTPPPTSRDVILERLDTFDRSVRMSWRFRAPSDNGFELKFHVPKPGYDPGVAHPYVENYLAKVREDLERSMLVSKPPRSTNFNISKLRSMTSLASDPHLEFRQADKNLGLTVMTWSVYHEKVLKMLSDTSTYLKVPENRAKALAKRFLSECKRLLKDHASIFGKASEFISLTFEGSTWSFPLFYGIPKLHKPGDWLLRPIIPSFCWCTHQLSVWVSHNLNDVVKRLETCVPSTISLIRDLEKTSFHDDCEIGTVDVTALYPSIPIDKGVDVVVSVLTDTKRFSASAITVLRICMLLILKFNVFRYHDGFYLQIKGTAMGSSFAPSFANLFLYGLEKVFASSWRHLFFYKRYIDDIFFVVRKGFSSLFVNILNRFYEGVIVFTCEIGEESVNFLDLVIFKGDRFSDSNRLDFKVFQKTTNLYQYIPFSSEHPLATKEGFIKGELVRYAVNSSTYSCFREIRQLFFFRLRARGYPSPLLLRNFSLVSYSIRLSKLYPLAKIDRGRPLFLNIPFDRWTTRLSANSALRSNWTDRLLSIDPYFNPPKPSIVYSKGRSIFDIVRSLQKRAREESLNSLSGR
jgi:hypothetical protein